jgi:hypothetical protein
MFKWRQPFTPAANSQQLAPSDEVGRPNCQAADDEPPEPGSCLVVTRRSSPKHLPSRRTSRVDHSLVLTRCSSPTPTGGRRTPSQAPAPSSPRAVRLAGFEARFARTSTSEYGSLRSHLNQRVTARFARTSTSEQRLASFAPQPASSPSHGLGSSRRPICWKVSRLVANATIWPLSLMSQASEMYQCRYL